MHCSCPSGETSINQPSVLPDISDCLLTYVGHVFDDDGKWPSNCLCTWGPLNFVMTLERNDLR